jgi:hypothetical protein
MEKDSILKKSPIDFAEEGLKDFMKDKTFLSFNMGGGDADEKIRNLTGKERLLNYRSAKDNREPTEEELKSRVKYAYLSEYLETLKGYVKKAKQEAWDLKKAPIKVRGGDR